MNSLLAYYHTIGLPLSMLVLGTFLLAGAVKGLIGMGLPTIAMGLLGLAMAPAQAAALLIMPSALTNLWQLAGGGHLRPLCKRLWPLLVMSVLGTLAGSAWLGLGAAGAGRALGLALLVYAVMGLCMPAFTIRASWQPLLGPFCGLLTGLIAATTGVFVVPAVPYLQALGLSRDELVQALGLSFTASTLALAAMLFWRGELAGGELGASLLVLAPALLGMVFGQWLRQRISAVLFKRCFFIGLALLGVHLMVSG
ncbi:Sulfite exporter TauE/SafE [compost metagenome]